MPDRVIVRLPNWLGDTVMAEPLVSAFRAAWPGASLVLAGPWASLFGGQGLAQELIAYPRRWRGRLAARRTLRERAADTAVLLPGSFEAALAAWAWGVRRRVGFATGGRGPLLTDALAVPEPREHQVDEYARLGGALGVEVERRTPRLAPPAPESEARARARALVADAGVARGRGAPILGIHVGAAYGASKVWPLARVAELAALAREAGAVPLLLGAPTDVAFADAVRAREPVATLVGRDTPDLLPALLGEIDVLVGGDTGVCHLAAALGTAVVALFGPTDPRLSAPRGPVAVVRRPTPCAPCAYRTCPIDHPCMRAIEAREVYRAACALLGRAA